MTLHASVLFVCLGNICRSPLAEAAFRQEAERLALQVEVDSAGTADWHTGKAPDPRSCAVARARGVPIDHLAARQVILDDFRRFTHIFALDQDNLAALTALAPADTTAQVALLLDCVEGREGQDVADPYYGDAAGFDVTWRDVSEAATALAHRLARALS